MALTLTRSSRIVHHFIGCRMEELTAGFDSPQRPAQVDTFTIYMYITHTASGYLSGQATVQYEVAITEKLKG